MLAMTVLLGVLVVCMGSSDGGSRCNAERVMRTVDFYNPFAWARGALGGEMPGGAP